MPLALTDAELRMIMAAAAAVAYDKRGDFLRALAKALTSESDAEHVAVAAQPTALYPEPT